MPPFKLSVCEGRLRLSLLISIFPFVWFDPSPCFSQAATAETNGAGTAAPLQTPQKFTSKNFTLYTDLPEKNAQEVLERLETTLARISSYWGRRPRQRIECYVAHDLKNWSDSDFPHGFARALIGGIGGGAFAESDSRKQSKIGVTVYSSSRPGIAEHESVHAYCCQTFGSSGPDWYKEGMAEMATQGRGGKLEVECDAQVIDYLRRSPRQSIGQIVRSDRMNLRLAESLQKAISTSSSESVPEQDERIRQWSRDHADVVRMSRESYRSCWALCHFLSRNPNYVKRFNQLGLVYLTQHTRDMQNDHKFPGLFGAMQREMEFEYRFFLDRIANGYRVDLCHWDWKSKFSALAAKDSRSARIRAGFGYQSSGLHVEKNREYSFECSGTWQIAAEGSALNANGNEQGLGRLEGVIMTGYELSEPFELGHSGTFKAPAEGKLYLRCRDHWAELGDNSGKVSVKISHPPVRAAE